MTSIQRGVIFFAKKNLEILEGIKSSNKITIANDTQANQLYRVTLDDIELMSDEDKDYLELDNFEEIEIINNQDVTNLTIKSNNLLFQLYTFKGTLNVEICNNRNDIKIHFINIQ